MEGVETEISGAITPKWQIHAGYSYLHSQIKTAANPRDDGIFLLVLNTAQTCGRLTKLRPG